MTPAARIAAAIQVLDQVLAGAPAEKSLLNWARKSRFAGSSDRAALRDLVFTALRCQRSHAALGGAMTGRGLILGAMREAGQDPDACFTGQTHAPAPLSPAERAHLAATVEVSRAEALDCPDWLTPELSRSLGARLEPVMASLRRRAPAYLRVNRARLGCEAAAGRLAEEGIATRPVPNVSFALEVTENERKIKQSLCYRDGLVELQDAASQAVIEALPIAPGSRILDYCAGGGGKALAMAAASGGRIYVHDAEPARMRDLPDRAARAGADLHMLDSGALPDIAPFDLVLLDVPCSGSGSWRRSPEAKWRLTSQRLADLERDQAAILAQGARLVSPSGWLAYVTCSLLLCENEDRIAAFQAEHPQWQCRLQRRWYPDAGPDGFFLALLTRS